MSIDAKTLLFDLETLHRCARENPERKEPYRRLYRGLLDLFAEQQRIARLETALVEERAIGNYGGGREHWATSAENPDYHRRAARAELVAEGLLP